MKDRSGTLEMIKEFMKAQRKAEKYRKKATKLLNKARSLCTHPETDTKDSYYSGNYDTHASTEYRTYCKVCGELLNTRVEEHSWFG